MYIAFPSFPLFLCHRLQSCSYPNVFNRHGSTLGHRSCLGIEQLFLSALPCSGRRWLCPNCFLEVPLTRHIPKCLRTICKPVGQNRGKTLPTIYQRDTQVPVPGTLPSLISSCLCSLNFKQPGLDPHPPTKTRLILKMFCSTVKQIP